MTQLVLLDRDGTIIVEKRYLSSPDQVELLPDAAQGIQVMRRLGLIPVVATNQSGLARGYFSLETLDRIHQRMAELLANCGVSLDAIYVCPHHPDDGCHCRKPAQGLAWKAAHEFRTDLSRAFVVGDNVGDIELGKKIGSTTILVRTGYGARVAIEETAKPDYVVDNLLEAAHVIGRVIIDRGGGAGEPG